MSNKKCQCRGECGRGHGEPLFDEVWDGCGTTKRLHSDGRCHRCWFAINSEILLAKMKAGREAKIAREQAKAEALLKQWQLQFKFTKGESDAGKETE